MGRMDNMMNATSATRHVAAIAAQRSITRAVSVNAYGDFRFGINTRMSRMRSADRHRDDQGEG